MLVAHLSPCVQLARLNPLTAEFPASAPWFASHKSSARASAAQVPSPHGWTTVTSQEAPERPADEAAAHPRWLCRGGVAAKPAADANDTTHLPPLPTTTQRKARQEYILSTAKF